MTVALDPNAIMDRARVHLRRREVPQAIEVLRSLIVLGIEDAPVLELLGVCYSLSGDADWAIAMFQRVLAVAPDRVPAYVNLGALLVKRGDFAGAIACLEQAAQLDQTTSDIYHNLGIAYLEMRNWGRAQAALKAAVRLKPDSTGTLYRLGELYMLTNNVPVAITYFNKVLELNPQHVRAKHALEEVTRTTGSPRSNVSVPIASATPPRLRREPSSSDLNDIKLLTRDAQLKATRLLEWFEGAGSEVFAAFRKQVQNGVTARPAFVTARRDLLSQSKIACELEAELAKALVRLEAKLV